MEAVKHQLQIFATERPRLFFFQKSFAVASVDVFYGKKLLEMDRGAASSGGRWMLLPV